MNSELDVTLLREDELALKDFPFRPNCHCNTCFLLRRLIEERGRAEKLQERLGFLYDKWENGDPCWGFEDSLGNAFRLSYEEEQSILVLISPNPKGAEPLPAPTEKGKK